MLSAAFRTVPVLRGCGVRLDPLGLAVLEDYLVGLADPEVRRLTVTRGRLDRREVQEWLATRAAHHDRADWAVHRGEDGRFLGEAVLSELRAEDASVNYRVWLGPGARGGGHGIELTRLVLDHAFAVGVHRATLTVLAETHRARRAYEKCGFRLEGVHRDGLWWDGAWRDELSMALLSTDPR